MKKHILMSSMALTLMGTAAYADEEKSLTMFTLGMESVQYSENTGSGITASGKNMLNLTQKSLGYTAVSDDFGFYITTVSTLTASQANESWTLGQFGTVQTNQRKVMLTDLHVQAAWMVQDSVQLLAGLGMNRMSFSRSGFTYPKGTRGTATGNPILFTPDPNGPIQQLTPAGGYIARQPGAVFEDSTSLMAEIGVNYDSFFQHTDGLRLIGSVRAAIPVYYYVTNSNYPNASWSNAFKGYNLHADLGLGYQLKDNFDFIISASGDYRYRPATSVDAVTGGFVPNATITIARLTAGLAWSF